MPRPCAEHPYIKDPTALEGERCPQIFPAPPRDNPAIMEFEEGTSELDSIPAFGPIRLVPQKPPALQYKPGKRWNIYEMTPPERNAFLLAKVVLGEVNFPKLAAYLHRQRHRPHATKA